MASQLLRPLRMCMCQRGPRLKLEELGELRPLLLQAGGLGPEQAHGGSEHGPEPCRAPRHAAHLTDAVGGRPNHARRRRLLVVGQLARVGLREDREGRVQGSCGNRIEKWRSGAGLRVQLGAGVLPTLATVTTLNGVMTASTATPSTLLHPDNTTVHHTDCTVNPPPHPRSHPLTTSLRWGESSFPLLSSSLACPHISSAIS